MSSLFFLIIDIYRENNFEFKKGKLSEIIKVIYIRAPNF